MRLSVFLHLHRNKILATSLAAIASVLFLAVYLYLEINTGWTYFRSDFRNIWNFVLTAAVYGLILVANIRNDNVAYHGILMFVFIVAFSFIWDVINGTVNVMNAFSSGDPMTILMCVGMLLFTISAIVIGFVLYVFILRYASMRLPSFRPVRIMGIVFSGVLFIACAFRIALLSAIMNWEMLFAFFGLPIAEFIMSVAIVFTLERLRRL